MIDDRSEFEAELSRLEGRFASLEPELEVTVRDSELGVEGYVVVWSTLAARGGPLGRVGKGGTRIAPEVTLDEVKMLARVMTLKNAGAGLPLGGAKSGLRADPSRPDFERSYRRFVRLVQPVLAENGGPFGGFGFDIGGRPEHALWACDELGSTRSFTGKPVDMGGTDYDRNGIAGFGVVAAAEALVLSGGSSLEGKTFAVQGLGAMGAAVVRYLSERGGILTAVADPRLGGTYALNGGASDDLVASIAALDFTGTRRWLEERKVKPAALDEILYVDVDLLFPAAVQNVIDLPNVEKVRARAVVEAANGPVTSAARSRLFHRKVDLVPDFIANPGGIIAAYVEMTADSATDKVRMAKEMTEQKITENVRVLYQLVRGLDVEPSAAGMYLALRNIFK